MGWAPAVGLSGWDRPAHLLLAYYAPTEPSGACWQVDSGREEAPRVDPALYHEVLQALEAWEECCHSM